MTIPCDLALRLANPICTGFSHKSTITLDSYQRMDSLLAKGLLKLRRWLGPELLVGLHEVLAERHQPTSLRLFSFESIEAVYYGLDKAAVV